MKDQKAFDPVSLLYVAGGGLLAAGVFGSKPSDTPSSVARNARANVTLIGAGLVAAGLLSDYQRKQR